MVVKTGLTVYGSVIVYLCTWINIRNKNCTFLNAHELIRKMHIELKISKLSRIYICELCWPYIYFRQKSCSFFFKIVDFRKCILLVKYFFNILQNLVLWFRAQVLKISPSKITVLKISLVKIYALKIAIYIQKNNFCKSKVKKFSAFHSTFGKHYSFLIVLYFRYEEYF